jgi:hypothetical protein
VIKIKESTVAQNPTPTTQQQTVNRKSSTSANQDELTPLLDFIENISVRSRSTMSTILVVFIYLGRLKSLIKDKHSPGTSSFEPFKMLQSDSIYKASHALVTELSSPPS